MSPRNTEAAKLSQGFDTAELAATHTDVTSAIKKNGSAGPRIATDSSQDVGQASAVPLVVDLDGTLVRSDLLIEAAFRELGERPASIFSMINALRSGKAALKHFICGETDFDPASLPYDSEVIALVQRARDDGRQVYIASASHDRLVTAVSAHLGLFDGHFATDEKSNLAGEAKAERLVEAFGEGNFDYVGNDACDLSVWLRARRSIAIRTSGRVRRQLEEISPDCEHLSHVRPTWKKWAKLFRVHQWSKNALVFVPLLAAHAIDPLSIATAMLAVLAFSCSASATYIINDLFDLREDRLHRTKKDRPLASGDIPLLHALVAVPLLLTAAAVIAIAISPAFVAVLAGYFALTGCYTLFLKRILMIDVLTLAGLYTIRMIGGAVALGISLSIWLMAFSLSIFISLALMKRFVEMSARLDAGQPDPTNRDYQTGDLGMLAALAAASGFNAVTVLALYVSNEPVGDLYDRPDLLWLVCPVLTYWIGRALMLAQRRRMHDDPVVFALKDPQSHVCMAVILIILLLAI